ncbi:MAG: biopolymer transporter ExbD [Pseudomonadota bacterium]|nr:biopolymer transporter ExbD [Pseudomonadota bacterium]
MAERNTKPLIDVLLVLLIMFVITIPVATHSVDMDLPRDCAAVDPTVNRLTIDGVDRLAWNGSIVGESHLAALLVAARDLPQERELRFEPAASASYRASARVLRLVERSGVTRFGFVGNEKYRTFGAR